MNIRNFRKIEWWIPICAIALCTIGLVALFSASYDSGLDEFKKQGVWLGVSIAIMTIVMMIDYKIIVRLSPILYGMSIISLIAVLFTEPINGARSWFDIGDGAFSLQPSELSKVFVIIFLAYIMSMLQVKGRSQINKIHKLGIILLIIAVPLILIVIEPDYGTAAAYMISFLLMIFVAGIDKKYIITAFVIVAIAVPVSYNFLLPNHAKQRIETYLNPEADPRGAGYNVLQSKLAIGAGQITGMGILSGNQTQLGYLHPKTTDFIFSVIGEEMGFIVAGSVIILNIVIIIKSIQVAKGIKDEAGAYIAVGIAGIFLFHTLENIGMTMGILPITGVPLLFVSYGGSSMMTSFMCLGILLNISSQRKNGMFNK
ncbi:MAG: rod shape-determining protein RodA [Clostridia bacterium]|nr:rod shape-determining protein RodA [Clostridia bacterium]